MDIDGLRAIGTKEQEQAYEDALAERVQSELEESEHTGRMTRRYLRGLCSPEDALDLMDVNDEIATYITGIWLGIALTPEDETEPA